MIKAVDDLLASPQLLLAQDLNHRLAEHCGHGCEAEGKDGGEDGLEAGDEEAVEAVKAVQGAENYVQTADDDGRDTTEEKLDILRGKWYSIKPSSLF